MEDFTNLVISIFGIIFNLIICSVYNQKFVVRYKKYKESNNEKIIDKYKDKIQSLFKKNNDSTKIEEGIKEMLKEFEEDNLPLRYFHDLENNLKWSLILLSISVISDVLFSRFVNIIFGQLTWNDVSFWTMLIGLLFFAGVIQNVYLLNKSITKFELEN